MTTTDWTWTIDLENTKFIESEDGEDFEARCTFKRSFAKGEMREITYNEDMHWMAGYNIYHSKDSVFRYVYGYSYESDKRNLECVIVAEAVRTMTTVSLALAALGASLLFWLTFKFKANNYFKINQIST